MEHGMHPKTIDELRLCIDKEYEQLSRRLKDAGDFICKNPESMALDTAAVVAEKAGVHASTLVRFANHFNFSGFTELQKLYKDHIQENYKGYSERIRLSQQTTIDNSDDTEAQLLSEFAQANIDSLQDLQNNIEAGKLQSAVGLLDKAKHIHVCGIQRAFPVSMYFVYALSNINIQTNAISGLGMMHNEQANCIQKGDVLIAITFAPYAQATQEIVKTASKAGAKVLLITDDGDCPSVASANIVFAIKDAAARSFRSLSSSLCLAQTLCISLGYRRENATEETQQRIKSA